MTAVFLDTVGLVALWDKTDQWHSVATQAYADIRQSRHDVVTTTFVLLECGNSAARRPYRGSVDRLRRELDGLGCVISPTEGDWRHAWVSSHAVHKAVPGLWTTFPSASCDDWG